MKIGVIADTHGYFDPAIRQRFKGVDHILHAGDVGTTAITSQLEQIAPVTVVIGNSDQFLPYRETEVVELAGRKYLVHHIIPHPRALDDPVRSRVTQEKPDVIVFGHTHKPFCQMYAGVLFFNPGYAGSPRNGIDRSVAVLRWENGSVRPEFLAL